MIVRTARCVFHQKVLAELLVGHHACDDILLVPDVGIVHQSGTDCSTVSLIARL